MSAREIIVYTQSGGWLFCDKLKEFLSQKGTKYTERDVAQDENALDDLERLGVFTTPVTVIDGVVVVGFDKPKLERLLELADE